MKTIEFIEKYNEACKDGKDFALQFETMTEVWENCKRPDWLFWILKRQRPLEKNESVRLSIAFAESCISNWTILNDERPLNAINAAKAWLDNTSEENESAAWSAAESAWSAAESASRSAARSAAESAAESAWSASRSAAESAESAAESAAWSAAESASRSAARRLTAVQVAWSAQCDLIRNVVKNPFI